MTTPADPMDPRPTDPQPVHPRSTDSGLPDPRSLDPQAGPPPTPTEPMPAGPPSVKDMSEAELKEDIERRRERIGETAEALTDKFDVKKQTQSAVHDAKHRAAEKGEAIRTGSERAAYTAKDVATDDRGKPKPVVLVAAALIAAGLVTVIVVSRRKRKAG